MLYTRRHDIVVRLVVLKSQPHTLTSINDVTPVTNGVRIMNSKRLNLPKGTQDGISGKIRCCRISTCCNQLLCTIYDNPDEVAYLCGLIRG